MSCTSWQDLLDETPLSAIDRARRADLEVHAAGCRTCAQRLATELLLSGAWAGERRLQPSRSLQAALLAVPRQEKRGRVLSLWAVPVSALAIGLLAWLAPDVLQRQRAQIDLPAAPAAGAPVAAPATATAVAGQVAPKSSPMAADRPARAFGSGRAPAPQAVAGSTAPPAAAATPLPAVPGLGSAGRGDAPRPDRSPHATPTAADMSTSKAATGPGPTEPDPGSTSDPGGDEPIGTAAPQVTPGAGLRPGPGETATPEQGPSERPVPPGVTSTPGDRGATVVPSTPTTAAGTAAPGIQPSPSETPTPTAAVTETVTPTPTPTAP